MKRTVTHKPLGEGWVGGTGVIATSTHGGVGNWRLAGVLIQKSNLANRRGAVNPECRRQIIATINRANGWL